MDDITIHYTGAPFLATVNDNDTPGWCRPIVFETDLAVGAGYRSVDDTITYWGFAVPHDLILSWRASQLIRRLDRVGYSTACDCCYAAMREPRSGYESRINSVIAAVGRPAYDEIMAMRVPDEIIHVILDSQNREEELTRLDTDMIPNEVRLGTMEWRQEFEDLGLEHPSITDSNTRYRKSLVRPYEEYLQSLGEHLHAVTRDALIMVQIEEALVEVSDCGVPRRYDHGIAVALAAVRAETVHNTPWPEYIASGMLPGAQARYFDERINGYALWLFSTRRAWRRKYGIHSVADAKQLLTQLMETHFPGGLPQYCGDAYCAYG